jgi:hypothetical protein
LRNAAQRRTWTFYETVNLDELAKNRHSGESRIPDALQLFENTGFQLSPE